MEGKHMADSLEEALIKPITPQTDIKQWIDDVYTDYLDVVQTHNGNPPWSTRGVQEPSRQETMQFLRDFINATQQEQRTDTGLQSLRVQALRYIKNYVKNSTDAGFHGFPNIDQFRFAIELALRVRRPRVIDQCRAVLCGSAAVLQGFFKTDPVGAANFALHLGHYGWAMLKDKLVDPPSLVKSTTNHFDESPVDWCMLASLRYHFEPLATGLKLIKGSEAADPLRQYTKPGLLAAWLRKMGYTKVKDRTFGSENFSLFTKGVNKLSRYPMHDSSQSKKVGEVNLDKAIEDLNLGCLVFLWAYASLSQVALGQRTGPPVQETTTEGFPALHWTLVRKLQKAGNQVTIRLYTWGASTDAGFDKDDFLRVYLGHVMADPR
jgi:hypothetical protein